MKWSEMKEKISAQMNVDPQRATLASRAAKSVEEGLAHLAGAGYTFEIAPRGTLAELTLCSLPSERPGPRSLTVEEASDMVSAPEAEDRNEFEAQETLDA
jgi:hypothetical protein